MKDRGRALGVVAGEIQAFVESSDEYTEPADGTGDGQLKEERLALGAALADVVRDDRHR